ncbi:MAG: zinc-ribbon domain-containing protein [Solirubrobacteraceae bacterium]
MLAEWDPVHNAGLDPRTIGPSSVRKVWWRCATCGHQWRATPEARTKGYGRPSCGHRRTGEATRARNLRVAPDSSFAALRPDLLPEWHPTRNQGLDPWALSPGSNVMVWWRCVDCANEWQTTPHPRPGTARRGSLAVRRRHGQPPRFRSILRHLVEADRRGENHHVIPHRPQASRIRNRPPDPGVAAAP